MPGDISNRANPMALATGLPILPVVPKPFTIDDLQLAVTKALELPELTVDTRIDRIASDGDSRSSQPSQPN